MSERFDDANWALAMALAGITFRTKQAVATVKNGGWTPATTAISDLLSAMRSKKLVAHGMFEGERIPHLIDTAVWSTFEIIVKPTMFVGRTARMPIVIARRMGPPHTQLLSPTMPAAKISCNRFRAGSRALQASTDRPAQCRRIFAGRLDYGRRASQHPRGRAA